MNPLPVGVVIEGDGLTDLEKNQVLSAVQSINRYVRVVDRGSLVFSRIVVPFRGELTEAAREWVIRIYSVCWRAVWLKNTELELVSQ